MQNIVKFENQEIELLAVEGVPMMTLSQIVTALDASPNQATQLYNRHADEFTEEMTRIVPQGRTRVRVFNREGAWLIGMFARTPKAAAFRKWVLKALAAHVDGSSAPKPVTVSEHTRALPSGKREIVLSEKAKAEIGGIVKACLGTSKAGTPLDADALKQLIKEAVAEFFTPPADDGENHPSGRPFANWAITAVHSVGAMQSEYDALRDKMKQAQNLLTAK